MTAEKEKKAPVRDTRAVEEEVGTASTAILDIIDVKGKVTKPGPAPLPCSSYPADAGVNQIHHPWSVYDVPFEDLRAAMDRLRDELPQKGWKIVQDGPDGTVGNSPQIVANSTGGHLSADIRLQDERSRGDKPSFIEVTVVSDCFRDKA